MIVKTIDDKIYSQLKEWLKRKGYTNTVKITDKTFIYLAGIVLNCSCTKYNAKERLYNYILKNSRLGESARANRIRNGNVKENKKISKRNGFNGGYTTKRSRGATKRG